MDETGRYGNFSTKSDIFSLGMILFFMCFGRLPYKSADSIQEELEDVDMLRAEISSWSGFQDERRERPDLPGQLYHFLQRLLAINPIDRPNAAEILHALRTEKGLDNPPRSRHGSASGIGGRIIQSIDSPMPPSTPVNGKSQHHQTDSIPPILISIEPTKARNAHPYVEEPTSITPSPNSSPSHQLTVENIHRLPSQPHEEPAIKTPLLMPPPTTFLTSVTHQLSLYKHYTQTWATHNRQSLQLGTHLIMFVAKVASITKPCDPLATREVVWWPLVVLAALELALAPRVRWRVSSMFTLAHIAMLIWVTKLGGGGLCVKGSLHAHFEDDWKHSQNT